jgi:hypothetical protein
MKYWTSIYNFKQFLFFYASHLDTAVASVREQTHSNTTYAHTSLTLIYTNRPYNYT